MKVKPSVILNAAFVLFAFCLGGCFDEPEPAYRTVPKEARVYLSDKGFGDLSGCAAALAAGAKIDYLNLDRNALTNVDPVAKLTGLKWLRLNGNRLTSLPDLKGLTSLRRIYLANNRLSAVPETLKDLPSLTDVELSGNPIDTVPAWLAEKPGLKNISLNRTRVTSLPKDLSAWRSLSSLQLGDLSVSAEEMARIRKELPNVAIVF